MSYNDTYSSTVFPKTHGALVTMDHNQSAATLGTAWTATYKLTNTAATSASVLITTPATGTYTLNVDVETTASASWTLSEAPNATATGSSAITGICNNRTINTADPLTLVGNGTYTSSGTVLENHQSSTIIGGKGNILNVWTLAVSSTYLIRTVEASGNTTIIGVFYHEH